MKAIVTLFVILLIFLSCKYQSTENNETQSVEAKYVLPYPVGMEYTCSQTFNGPYSHYGTFRYSVDFAMTIGTLITAARSGHVVYILQDYSNNDQTEGHENVVIVMHTDSTYARYAHITPNGALVKIGQTVTPGDSIAWSGNSGSSGAPHLHFDVTKTHSGRGDQTIPYDFKNTIPHPVGLKMGASYKALQY